MSVGGTVHGKYLKVTQNRLACFTDAGKKEVNLRSKLYSLVEKPTLLTCSQRVERIPFKEAISTSSTWKEAKIGQEFGPAWATFWMEVRLKVPNEWKDKEVHFIWDSECEALLWTPQGRPLQGLLGSQGEDRRVEYIVSGAAKGGEELHYFVEVSCTAMFGNGKGNGWGGLGPNPTDLDKKFSLKQVEIAVFDRLAHELLQDFIVIQDMAKEMVPESNRANQALFTANLIMNTFDMENRSTWTSCRDIAAKFLSLKNGESQHIISAVGHCHIDTAWLWPYAETKRKCARSWASQLRICEQHPNYKFACSQAQQYEWVKELYPHLYSEIREMVKKGQFVPVGGTWVEMDCNIPSGESLIRQFLFGQQFFQTEFGAPCKEFWLPDTFGYAAQLPQIIRGSDIEFFLTQKLSWSQFNKFPHHTFYWEGLDGTRVLTHFPPTDTYNAQANVKDTVAHIKNYLEKSHSNESLMVFGHGDGGGGPLKTMVESLERLKDVDGLPRIDMRSPIDFFERCKKEAKNLSTWVGELYFEYHRGTYTTQAFNKFSNRKGEFLLRDVELFGSLGLIAGSVHYPTQELSRLWKLLLLNQFHDVIPGSSINEVYKDSREHYEDIAKSGNHMLGQVVDELINSNTEPASKKRKKQPIQHSATVLNSLGWSRMEVVELPSSAASKFTQELANGNALAIVSVNSMGFEAADPVSVNNKEHVSISENGVHFILENKYVKATIHKNGTLLSFFDKVRNREAVKEGETANQYAMYEDIPMYWDAWDVDIYHLEKRQNVAGADSKAKITEKGPLRVTVEIECSISSSSKLKQCISLTCLSPRLDFDCWVDWHESHKFLKVEFPLDIRAMHATYEIQFGHCQRPTHWNTSWEVAKFEVCAHKWADLSESGFGVSLINDCKYGHATHGNVLRLSLLRSAKNPDPEADMGIHTFKYALLPHGGVLQEAGVQQQGVVREAYNFNVPLIVKDLKTDADKSASFFGVDHTAMVIDTVKKAEGSEKELIVRLYESHGGRCQFKLSSALPVVKVQLCNMVERITEDLKWEKGSVQLIATPFQVISLKLSFA